MNAPKNSGVPKWPFLLGDFLLLALGWWIASRSPDPFGPLPLLILFSCVGLGAWISVMPFLTEYRGALRIAEAQSLQSVADKINQLEKVGQEVAAATGQWQEVQGQAETTKGAVAEIAERMTAEAKAFGEFMQKANETEKQHLRLEVEKLRRAEGDWLQIMVLLMDHVYALYRAAQASRKPSVIEQISNFQRACREVVRRIGLVPFEIITGDPYDANLHQLEKPELAPVEGQPAQVEATLATGYTYQGQALRKPLISLAKPASNTPQTGDLFLETPSSQESAPAAIATEDPLDSASPKTDNPSLQSP